MTDITFVDAKDHVIGSGSKKEARTNGIAHRIARIFIFNSQGELLIQQRAPNVDSPNKWDQSAGGHVDTGEDYLTAAIRELEEELGIADCNLVEIGKFYTETRDGDETVKRFNMIYAGRYDGEVHFDEHEVSTVKWIQTDELESWMKEEPEAFTRVFRAAYDHYRKSAYN